MRFGSISIKKVIDDKPVKSKDGKLYRFIKVVDQESYETITFFASRGLSEKSLLGESGYCILAVEDVQGRAMMSFAGIEEKF